MGVTHNLKKATSATYLSTLKDLIHDAASKRIKGTLRNFQYGLIGILHPAKNKDDFDQVGRIVKGMRLRGEVDWDVFDERHRSLLHRGGHDDLPDFIQSLPTEYRRDHSQGQPEAVYIVYEADGMSGLVQDICGPLGASWAATKGNSSDVLQHKVARSIVAEDRPAFIGVVSDHDPEGYFIYTDSANSIPWMVGALRAGLPVADFMEMNGIEFDQYKPVPEPVDANGHAVAPDVEVVHLGVHADLLDRLANQGITVPDEGGSRSPKSVNWPHGGHGKTQVEAVAVDIIREVISDFVHDHTDLSILNKQKLAEEEDRRRLRAVARYLANRDRRKGLTA